MAYGISSLQIILGQTGDWLQRHQRWIQFVQWSMVVVYLILILIPAFMVLPEQEAKIHNSLVRFAQFLFWGIWWPFVILSMMLFGRMWCGIFCPEGTLTEFASRYSRNLKPVPKWLKWRGWAFVAFILTTLYGQLVSVYDYALPTLLILGGSTVAAMFVGLIWLRERRAWCRYLCPVSGVFSILSRLAPVHFYTDQSRWAHSGPSQQAPVICAPMISIKKLESNSHCHMCGRCSGYRDSIQLKARSPNAEILSGQTNLTRWEQRLIIFGLLGVALAAFQWTVSPWFVQLKQMLAGWAIDHQWWWILSDSPAWWLLTRYPSQNDVFNYIDGISLLIFIGVFTGIFSGAIWMCAQIAAYISSRESDNELGWQYAECLTPLAGISAFLGLSMITVSLLAADGYQLLWKQEARIALLVLGSLWSFYLCLKKTMSNNSFKFRGVMAMLVLSMAIALVDLNWILVFFVW